MSNQSGQQRAWSAAGIAALAVAVVVAISVLIGGGGDRDSDRTSDNASGPSTASALADGQRWMSFRDVEVGVPEAWPLDDSSSRPDCVHGAEDGRSWGVPDHHYVEVSTGFGGVAAVGCMPTEQPADMPSAFGVLPFGLWQSHVTLSDPNTDNPDGTWTYRDWTLTRATAGDVQISVLESPADAGLASGVTASLRVVTTNVDGCPVEADVERAGFQRPEAPGVPTANFDGVVAVCQYDRSGATPSGLVGSRQITGVAARRLVDAIGAAPDGGGPDRPQNCTHDEFGDTGILLRFLPSDSVTRDGSFPEAYVYYDWCFGNGIIDSSDERALTVADCRPLFGGTVRLWTTQSNVWPLCAESDR
ncbi:hypothetical protein [Nocardioides panacisoli]|uniref:Uncharacterized protein n=1 Tax=Nocardioides panacisoli TaxID=627624 RepID=A0ABP7I2S9_9ACTN